MLCTGSQVVAKPPVSAVALGGVVLSSKEHDVFTASPAATKFFQAISATMPVFVLSGDPCN